MSSIKENISRCNSRGRLDGVRNCFLVSALDFDLLAAPWEFDMHVVVIPTTLRSSPLFTDLPHFRQK